MKTILLLAFSLMLLLPSAQAQLTIEDTFGDLAECDTMTRGIYIIWWDKDFDSADKVDVLLDTMLSYRQTCLTTLGMQDPPNVEDGHYYNVYLHSNGYFSSYGWGNGQGTDANGYPFLTLPLGLVNDWPNTAHETFHIFQYNATAPGFAYAGDSQWYIEASANWFAARENPDEPRRFVEAESLVRIPHVPFWLSYDNYPVEYPSNWQRYVHQYALALYLYYLTDVEGISEDIITSGLYSTTSEKPQEFMYNLLGSVAFRQSFIDWAAHMTNDFDFIPAIQAATNLNEWNTYADPDDDHEFVAIYENEGTNGWVSPNEDEVTNAWSFNTWKLQNSQDETYTFELNGDALGSYGDAAIFQGKVLVQNSTTGAAFYDLLMDNDLHGTLSLTLTLEDTAVFLIVASMPSVFEDVNPDFQLFPYEIQISTGAVNSILEPEAPGSTITGRYNLVGQPVTARTNGIQVLQYADGRVEKIFVRDEE
ncbi:MAG: hypothetical protein K9I85_10470 [Saprospiraceae bacterium]|nr:hypothetical protein [Saprospiraceae bacterium]